MGCGCTGRGPLGGSSSAHYHRTAKHVSGGPFTIFIHQIFVLLFFPISCWACIASPPPPSVGGCRAQAREHTPRGGIEQMRCDARGEPQPEVYVGLGFDRKTIDRVEAERGLDRRNRVEG